MESSSTEQGHTLLHLLMNMLQTAPMRTPYEVHLCYELSMSYAQNIHESLPARTESKKRLVVLKFIVFEGAL